MAAATSAYAAPFAPGELPACSPLPLGSGPVPSPDTPEQFQSYAPFSAAATSAITPGDYVQSYSNLLVTFNEPRQFVGYSSLSSYNVSECAAKCDEHSGCNAFSIFYERLPTIEPGTGCMDPASTTMIKCDLWNGTILPSITLNSGQMRGDFKVVMAGSNAYVKDIPGSFATDNTLPPVPAGYTIEQYANGGAIIAPTDCNGSETYMGMRYWADGQLDITRCLAACHAAGEGDIYGRQCRFINTYIQRRNGVPTSQHCSMYSNYWPSTYATNLGQSRGSDLVTISATDSYGIRDMSDDYHACLPPSVSQASSSTTTAFQYDIVAPETFTDWDPVSETTTYSTPTTTAEFQTPYVAPNTFTDWSPISLTTTYAV
ncbi:hypothetical protein BDW02DRAFT_627691 [Decorospora gaudefroyi]|uniref:Apple domain-containing protein n=1 Tax=Decorospora gaudefroyi TaxID=184978 RepID=A0A6A5KQ13_9PLEO|nr:hypothetical protein BDW02DRAFT_627691 [Decorospora gaudefroyi]